MDPIWAEHPLLPDAAISPAPSGGRDRAGHNGSTMQDSFDITTLIFIVLAVFVVWRLRSVLGQKTGSEQPPLDPISRREPPMRTNAPSSEQDNVVRLPGVNGARPAADATASAAERWKGFAEPGTPMGRMEDQLPGEVKQARVEELMLTQQEVAFARSKAMVGNTIDVLIDRPAGRDDEDGFVARSQAQAPDIDIVTFVHGKGLHAGQLVSVKVTDYQAYDLVAEVPRKRSRTLSLIRA